MTLQELKAKLRVLIARGHGSSLQARELRAEIKREQARLAVQRTFGGA